MQMLTRCSFVDCMAVSSEVIGAAILSEISHELRLWKWHLTNIWESVNLLFEYPKKVSVCSENVVNMLLHCYSMFGCWFVCLFVRWKNGQSSMHAVIIKYINLKTLIFCYYFNVCSDISFCIKIIHERSLQHFKVIDIISWGYAISSNDKSNATKYKCFQWTPYLKFIIESSGLKHCSYQFKKTFVTYEFCVFLLVCAGHRYCNSKA